MTKKHSYLVPGSRKLPTQHITLRVPWHDDVWRGTVCKRPLENTSCLVLKRIGECRKDEEEQQVAGACWDHLSEGELPACLVERGAFMASFDLSRGADHPYRKGTKAYEHFQNTPFVHRAFSAAGIPFRWMLRSFVEGNDSTNGMADDLGLLYDKEREAEIQDLLGFPSAWVQDRKNQLVMLDTFFGALEPQESLCFLYAKRTPLSEDSRRVIVGVGRVLSVGEPIEYDYSLKNPDIRCVLWERNVTHSIREGFEDGFLFPYQALLERAAGEEALALEDLEDLVAFAPDERFESYSYATEHLDHDGAIASLLVCADKLKKIAEILEGPWDVALHWIDQQLNRLWKMRGPFPGLGSALCAFGLEHGNLVAYEIISEQAKRGEVWNEDPWPLVDKVFQGKGKLSGGIASSVGAGFRKKWERLPAKRRALLMLLSRFTLDAAQATRFYQPTEREAAGIDVTDDQLIANPYLLYEQDRIGQAPRIGFGTIDRGMFPEEIVRLKHPIPVPSALEDAIDARRVRALAVSTLEAAAVQGHTLLPRDWLIRRVRDREMRPACPLDEDTLAVCEGRFGDLICGVETAGGTAFQLDRFVEAREIIAKAVRDRARGKRHGGTYDWRGQVDKVLKNAPDPASVDGGVGLENTARAEKAAALEEIYGARVSVLLGPAGTGKTTLLRMLCEIPKVKDGGILLLAPTGKARVRLEEQTGMRGRGKTIAQFLLPLGRYDLRTGSYLITGSSRKSAENATVILDECSMLTEEQLAALLDGIGGVQRLVLVGDPRQLPPIGAGRPFVDIVRKLAPVDVESRFPRVGPCYAELTMVRRQTHGELADVQLAQWFSGSPCDVAADEIWQTLDRGGNERIEVVSWASSEDLEEKLVAKLVEELGLEGPEDENGFERSLGGSRFGACTFFWAGRNGESGAAVAADAWQILSPVRAQHHGVDAMNRRIQARFRKSTRALATNLGNRPRKIPKPMGSQEILYGDKVIQVINQSRRHVWPRRSERLYLANGDIGIVVGEYKTKRFPGKPKNLEVEFTSEPGTKVKYFGGEFSDDGTPPLELAYALTVHKAQGSEFKLTFVVLPNPCRLLSRELLYTALTRQQEKVVVFHQGELRDFRKFGAPECSDVAQRLTNLFDRPKIVEHRVGVRSVWFEEGLIHRTERGDLVRSKSELVIANAMHQRGIDYHYEKPVTFPDGMERLPDFTIENDGTGEVVYWEHLGLLHERAYRKRWERKLEGYRRMRVLPWEEGGGENGMLVITRDDPGGGFDAQALAKLISGVFGC